MASYDTIELGFDNDVATLALDRPEKKNSLSPQLHREFLDALDEIRDRAPHLVVVTGNGDAFCGGMDLERSFLRPRREGPKRFKEAERPALKMFVELKQLRFPTIAKVNGWAFGGGFALQGVCDFAIASEEATLGLSEINFGLIPGGGAMWTLVHSMNRREAMYYAATGESFSAEKAKELGVLTKVVPDDELDDAVDELVETLLEKNPISLQFNKQVLERSRFMRFEDSQDYEIAKIEEMSYVQGDEWINDALGQFEDREFRPGLESYER